MKRMFKKGLQLSSYMLIPLHVNTALAKESEETFVFDRAEAVHRHLRYFPLSNQEWSDNDF